MKDSFSVVFLVGVMFYQNWKLALFAYDYDTLAAGLAKNLGKKWERPHYKQVKYLANLSLFV